MKIQILFFNLIFAFILVFSFTGCQKEKHKVEGQVFIVTNGGQNFPLGLVSIGFAKPNELATSLDSVLLDFDDQISDFEKSLHDLKNKIEGEYILKSTLWEDVEKEAKGKTLSSFADLSKDYALIDARPTYNQFRKFMELEEQTRDIDIKLYGVSYLSKRFKLPTLNDYYAQKLKIDQLLQKHNEMDSLINEFKKGHSILPLLQPKFTVTKTNAQGDFSIEAEKGDYIVFATASRLAGTSTEQYMWAEKISINGAKTDLFLSNDNLVTIDEIKMLNQKQ
ncbi:hypothetical protein GCM10028791_43590 [Echinicola sediminis]